MAEQKPGAGSGRPIQEGTQGQKNLGTTGSRSFGEQGRVKVVTSTVISTSSNQPKPQSGSTGSSGSGKIVPPTGGSSTKK